MLLKSLGVVKSFLLQKYLYADLIVTERCNMRCQMCDYWKREHSGKEMDYRGYLSVSDKLKRLGVRIVSITGGEPLLLKDIFKIIKLFSKDFFVFLNTNGTLVNKKNAHKLKDSGLSSISISIDSLTPKHDKQRGVSGTLDKALRALKLLQDSGINVVTKAVLTKMNEDEIEDLIKFARNNNTKIGFNFYTEMMSGKKTDLSLSHPKRTIEKLLKLKKQYRNTIVTTYYYFEKGLDFYRGNLPTCQAGLFYFCIFPNGNISRCAKLKNEVLANIKQDNFGVLRQKLSQVKPSECNSCWVSCRGEVDPFRTDFLNRIISYLGYR